MINQGGLFMKHWIKIKSRFSSTSVYWKFIISNLVMFLCSFLVLTVIFIPTNIISAREIDKSYFESQLQSASSYMDIIFISFANSQEEIENSEWLRELYFDKVIYNKELSHVVKSEIKTSLLMINTRNSFYQNVSFMLYGDNTLYNISGVYEDYTNFQKYDEATSNYRFFPLDDKKESGLAYHRYGNENQYSALLYRCGITDLKGASKKGEMNILLNEAVIERKLRSLIGDEVTKFRIKKADGATLYEIPLRHIGTEDVVSVSAAQSSKGYTYEIDVPASVYHKTENKTKKIIVGTIISDILLSIILVIAFSKANYKPIRSLVKKYSAVEKTSCNEVDLLGETMNRMLNDKAKVQGDLDELRPLARQKLISRLLYGILQDEQDFIKMEQCGLDFKYPLFCVISAQVPFSKVNTKGMSAMDYWQNIELAFETTVEVVLEDLNADGYVFFNDFDHYSILVNYSSQNDLEVFVDRLADDCSKYFEQTSGENSLYFGIGDMVEKPSEIFISAQQASLALNYSILYVGGSIIWYSNIQDNFEELYYYPMADEISIVNAITNGNMNAAYAVLDKIFFKNLEHKQLSEKAARCLYYDLYSTILKTAGSLGLGMENLVNEDETERPDNLYAMHDYLVTVIKRLCNVYIYKKTSKGSLIEKKILEYTEEHLYDPNLSVGSIAENFDMSIAYVSTLFKNQMGTSYSEYINKARIEKATELSKTTKMSTEEIYKQVGYISMSTYRRNFIKYNQKNPGRYK